LSEISGDAAGPVLELKLRLLVEVALLLVFFVVVVIAFVASGAPNAHEPVSEVVLELGREGAEVFSNPTHVVQGLARLEKFTFLCTCEKTRFQRIEAQGATLCAFERLPEWQDVQIAQILINRHHKDLLEVADQSAFK